MTAGETIAALVVAPAVIGSIAEIAGVRPGFMIGLAGTITVLLGVVAVQAMQSLDITITQIVMAFATCTIVFAGMAVSVIHSHDDHEKNARLDANDEPAAAAKEHAPNKG